MTKSRFLAFLLVMLTLISIPNTEVFAKSNVVRIIIVAGVTLKNVDSTVNWQISNKNDRSIKVTITDDKTGGVMFKSGEIKPGNSVGKLSLLNKEQFKKGTYDATAKIICYDSENPNFATNSVKVVVVIKN